jgi:hypothetical protein
MTEKDICEAVFEAVYGEKVRMCSLCGKLIDYCKKDDPEPPEFFTVVELVLCSGCGPTPSKPGMSATPDDISPWQENAIRAMEE